jgi:tetratricopeptide (TPR) repeat protein
MRTEPENTEWAQAVAAAESERAELLLALGRDADASGSIASFCSAAEKLVERDRTVTYWRAVQGRCQLLKANLALHQGANQEALALARQAVIVARAQPDPMDRAFALASAYLTLGDALRATGQSEAAGGAYEQGLAAFPAHGEFAPREIALRATLVRKLGRDASPLERQLSAMGYRHPDYFRRRG